MRGSARMRRWGRCRLQSFDPRSALRTPRIGRVGEGVSATGSSRPGAVGRADSPLSGNSMDAARIEERKGCHV